MKNDRRRRRMLGAAMLGVAIAMLILGETILRGSLPPLGFIFYYTLCLVLTATAIIIALADARSSAQRTIQEQRELMNTTLKNLQNELRGENQAGSQRKAVSGDSNQL